jgi:hypothetical protein
MAKEHEYRYEFEGASEDMGIRFMDTKTKEIWMLDEKTGELIGVGKENWHKRKKITKDMDIDPRIPYFKKLNKKFLGKDKNLYDTYTNIKGDRFIHEKKKNLFIGIDKINKGIILHIKQQQKMPVFATLPFVHYPLYIQRTQIKQYPFGLVGGFMATQTFLIPYVEQLATVNPALAITIGGSPIIAGLAFDLIRRKGFRHGVKEDIIKLEKELKFALEHEAHAIKKWEKAHFEKKMRRVI